MQMRKTKNRQLMLEILEAGGAYSAQGLHEVLPQMDLVTIYRNLSLFVDEGLISEIRVDKEQVLYEINKDDHQHAKCNDCGEIRHFEIDKAILLKSLNLEDFEIDDVEVIVRGRCK